MGRENTPSSFLGADELHALGLASIGRNVLISRYARFYRPGAISVGSDVRIDDFCVLVGGSGIVLGSYIHIGTHCVMHGASGIVMEDYTCLSGRVTLYTESDDFSGASLTNPTVPMRYKPGYRRGPIVLRRHSIVGTNSTLMPGVELGEGAAVGAHSLVTKSCKPWTVYVGVPARPVKPRKRDILALEAQFVSDRSREEKG